MRRNNSKIRSSVSCVFAFLLSLLFLAIFVLLGLYFGIFNDRIIISKVSESNYYNEVQEELQETAETILVEAGLPTSVLAEAISLERVYIGGKYYIEDTLAGDKPVIETERIRADLTSSIDQYLVDEGITRTEELDTGVKEIISVIEQEYRRGIEFQFIQYITIYKTYYRKILNNTIPVLLFLVGLICFFLIKMQRYKHRGIRYITYAMIASTGMTILSAAYLLLAGNYKLINAAPEYYKTFLTTYLKWGIQVFLYLGGIGVIISILLLSLVGYMKNKTMNR